MIVIEYNINISNHNPLAGGSYLKLPKEIDHPWKGLINIQNINNNECFKWSLVKHFNLADQNSQRITKADKNISKRFDFKDIKFPVKSRDIHKIEKRNSIGISVFGYENNQKHLLNVPKKYCEEEHVDLLLIEEERRSHIVFIKDFNTYMFNHTLNHEKNIFVVIVYRFSVYKKYENIILKTALKLIANKEL